jgi:hypothetical protein
MPTIAQTLFAEIIDYAGLFPPARLPMDEAFARFVKHRSSDAGWLMARFVCPAARLPELAPLIEGADLRPAPVRIAALGAGGDDQPAYAGSMEDDVGSMASFIDGLQGKAVIDAFEVKLPSSGDPSEVVDFTIHHLDDLPSRAPVPYFEVPLLGAFLDPAVVASSVAIASHLVDPGRRAGLKIRCGGLDAAAIPTVEAVAAAVAGCRASSLPLKATQGLHHPVRRHDSELGATTHGFLNVFAASILGDDHDLDESEIGKIVAEEDPAAFSLTETALGWRGLESGFQGIARGRMTTIASFGSCSFSEPRDDLAAFGWL